MISLNGDSVPSSGNVKLAIEHLSRRQNREKILANSFSKCLSEDKLNVFESIEAEMDIDEDCGPALPELVSKFIENRFSKPLKDKVLKKKLEVGNCRLLNSLLEELQVLVCTDPVTRVSWIHVPQ